jgi:DNA helicase II / ATP-dependent DNA helicase PcrA
MSNSPECPTCGKLMVKRISKYGAFWGCSQYPKCRTTLDIKPVTLPILKIAKPFTPSIYQVAVKDFALNGSGNAVVEAVAGSGKTSTIIWLLSHLNKLSKICLVTFNAHIKDELARRAPNWVKVMTVHALGFAALRKAYPHLASIEPDEDKLYNIVKEMLPLPEDAPLRGTLCRLVSLAKMTLVDADDVLALEEMSVRYGIDVNGSGERLYGLVATAMRLCLERIATIDYDDMIWLPLVLNLGIEQFDWLLGDEVQDWNKAQLTLLLRALKPGGRMIAVGDRHQSIYGFRGADVMAIPNLIEALNAVTLPLSICYRCPKSHVEMAQEIVPVIESAPEAIDGLVDYVSYLKALPAMKDGDLVLCRINAALVSCAYALIKRGIKATIRGRDIGKGLLDLIDKLEAYSIPSLIRNLDAYRAIELGRLEAKGNRESAIQALQDKCDTLIELTEGMSDLTALRNRISTIFDDKTKTGVILSTIHRAKGDEAEVVWIIKPELMPLKVAQDWEAQQEQNIMYVAYTRSKRDLHFVQDM